jgi:hypothetical protein
VDGRQIAEGTPGEVTQRLLRAFRELVAVRGTPIYTPATAERQR